MIMPLLAGAEHLSEYDSVGVTKKNGQTFVVHRVEQGETLYSLARRYGVHVDDIIKANPGMDKNLKIGKMVHIPSHQKGGHDSPAGTSGVAFHVVKSAETLFSIAKKYGVSVDDLKRWNNLRSNTLSPGMKLAVNNGMANTKVNVGEKTPIAGAENRKVHVVKQSETLFSISRQYSVSVEQIKDWNHLTGNALNIGQKLFVSNHMDATTAIKKQDEANSSMLPAGTVVAGKSVEKQKTSTDKNVTKTSPDLPVEKSEGSFPAGVRKVEDDNKSYEPAEKTTERGMAEVIGDASDSRKYLALHRTAPIGTIMQIKNEMNDQIVFVRVVGRIQNTGDNEKVLVKISKKAYDRLGALDKRFPVVISYVK